MVTRVRGKCCELPAVNAGWAESTAAVLKALSDPTRLTMMAALWRADEPICICDFTGSLDLSQPTISHHMAKLREAGLVDYEKRGLWGYYRARSDISAARRELLDQLLSARA